MSLVILSTAASMEAAIAHPRLTHVVYVHLTLLTSRTLATGGYELVIIYLDLLGVYWPIRLTGGLGANF
jgi:hypothetical protein